MELEPIALDGAHHHDVPDAAILHALRLPVRHFVQDDSLAVFIGPDETCTLVEVGHGVTAIARATRPARTKYLR